MESSSYMPDADFGRYLANVTERDIDLLLMEEFHISDDFVAWFCGELGLRDFSPDGAWHSLSDTDGESDLLLRVVKGRQRIGILIENKVGAPEQDLQAERYHLRGIRSREQGKLDDYVTVMCAPTCYLDALSPNSAYQHRVSYEQIAEWFSKQQGRRAAWRHQIMLEAIDQGRRWLYNGGECHDYRFSSGLLEISSAAASPYPYGTPEGSRQQLKLDHSDRIRFSQRREDAP